MIYPDVTVEEWCQRYKIELRALECLCGVKSIPDRPFASVKWVGVLVSRCQACGRYEPAQSCVHRDRREGEQAGLNLFG